MLRKVLWMGLMATSAMVARRTATKIWRIATGEEPPVRK
jgi:hypothetical protein